MIWHTHPLLVLLQCDVARVRRRFGGVSFHAPGLSASDAWMLPGRVLHELFLEYLPSALIREDSHGGETARV